ncbi:MAG TPA: undecaprenyldiphospho-muramoylpentapeptide beta-N-acetylglucosaminyltransferase, partial [Burkholderiaceae bacterium]|nr:undecaprenyldiphospho-muramoylpentapeptide beta-N-acetylglucosaminyltransferase [Burkholderiaceae bacterium]
MTHLVIMAAGTGGHVMPGLAVAREALGRGFTVSWLGTRHGMENRLVPPSGLALDTIAFEGLRGKGPIGFVRGASQLLGAFGACRRILGMRGASAVLGMGGYVCYPGGKAARRLGLPLMLVNADAALLLSNKALLGACQRIAFGFDGEAARRTAKGIVTGNPVRAEIEAIAPPAARFAGRTGPLRVLVVGGSLGALPLNEACPKALQLLAPDERPSVVHQAGERHWARVQAEYQARGVAADVLPFIDDMPRRLAECDVVVCRAGAITVSELCVAGVAGILVPLVIRTTSHQRDNAQYLAEHGAALHLPQPELTPERLAAELRAAARPTLLAMAERARALARPHAAARVTDELERLVGARRSEP